MDTPRSFSKPDCMDSGEIDISAVIQRLITGKTLLIPAKLKEKIGELNRKKVGRDQIVILWCWMDQMIHTRKEQKPLIPNEKTEKKREYLNIHADTFQKNLPWCNKSRLSHLKNLEALKLVKCDGKWRRQQTDKAGKITVEGKPLGYKITNRKDLVEYELESGKYDAGWIVPKITGTNPACVIARKNLDRLRLKMDLVAPAIHQAMLSRIEKKMDGWEHLALKGRLPESIKENVDWNKNFAELSGLLYPIIKINLNRGHVKRGPYGRLYSPFVNLKSVLRGVFEVDGEELVGLDMRAAQPTLLALSTGDKALLKDCKSDQLYKKIMCECDVGRETAKKIWMAYAYGNIRTETSRNKAALRCSKLAQEEYPITYKALNRQKKAERDYREVARGMIRKESKLFITDLMPELDQNSIYALSVHDGVYVKKSDKKSAKRHIEKSLGRGIAKMFNVTDNPIIKIEETRPQWLTDDYDLAPEIYL